VASKWVIANNRLKQKQISELKNRNMMTACKPEKENNYLL
jgi:hypothetical protein